MSLPWDELSPEPPPAPPSQPSGSAGPPISQQEPPAVGDIGAAIAVVLKDVMAEVIAYTKDSLAQGSDLLHPTITATTSSGRELVVADARNRSWRTFLQGLAIDLFAALAAILTTISQIDPPLDKAAWAAVGVLAIKTLIQTALAYFMRIKIQPTLTTLTGQKLAIQPLLAPVPAPGA